MGQSSLKLIDINSGEIIKNLAGGGEYGKFSDDGLFYFTKRADGGLWMLVDGSEKLIVDNFNIRSNLSWSVINGYLYNLVNKFGSYNLERIDIKTFEKIAIKLPFEGLRGHSISVDSSGVVYVVISKAKDIDVISIEYN